KGGGKTGVVSEFGAPPSVRPLRTRRPAAVPPSSGRPEGVHACDALPGTGSEALKRALGTAFVGAAPSPRSISVRSPIGPSAGASAALPTESGAGPCVARNVMSCCDKRSGNPPLRGGAQIQAPGAGSSCASRFQVATPKRCTLPSGCATQAQSARFELVGLQGST